MISKEDRILVAFGGRGREQVVLTLKEHGYNILGVVVPPSRDSRLTASIDRIRQREIPIIECDAASCTDVFQKFRGAILLSVGFPYLLSKDLLSLFVVCLNVHPTLLPRYRGPTSGAYILMNNETETGSTVHLMDEGMDTGAIVLQRRVALSRFDTVRSCQSKTYAIEPRLVLDALMLLEDPGFRPTPQQESHATMFGKRRKPEDSQIDPNKSLTQLYDFIRSCDPNAYPAFFFLEGQKVCIRLWRPERPPEESDETL